MEALQELTQEDPLLDLEWIPESRELLLRITCKIQLEVLTEVIRERYSLEVSFSNPTVIYKETPASTAEGEEVYLAPKPCWAIVKLWVEPLPRGSGIQFESVIKEKELPYRYQNHVRQSLPEAGAQGLGSHRRQIHFDRWAAPSRTHPPPGLLCGHAGSSSAGTGQLRYSAAGAHGPGDPLRPGGIAG